MSMFSDLMSGGNPINTIANAAASAIGITAPPAPPATATVPAGYDSSVSSAAAAGGLTLGGVVLGYVVLRYFRIIPKII